MPSSHTVGGPAPYEVAGTLLPGNSVGRPQRGTDFFPPIDDPRWSRPYPILPCNGLQWGTDGEAIHFSPVLPKGITSPDPSAIIYGIMTWVFYAAQGATVFSIEKTIDPKTPFLNIFTSDTDDWKALDALYERLIRSSDKMAEVEALCAEVRP